jgi:putative membrane protein
VSNAPGTSQAEAHINSPAKRWPAIAWLSGFFAVFTWSAIAPKDSLIWALEVAPAIIALVVLAYTRRRFPLTTLAYILILIHAWILMVGGHYTYAEVPLFDTIRDVFAQTRNNYDKVGHFAQGFIPAIITREIIIRNALVRTGFFTAFFTVCLCLAVSAFYELIEWWVALLSEQAAEAFLGTQGYVWDTQSDMGWALFGAIIALITLSRLHDSQIAKLTARSAYRS